MLKHDPEQYVYENYRKAVDHLNSGALFENTNVPPGLVYKPWTIDQFLGAVGEKQRIMLDGDWS